MDSIYKTKYLKYKNKYNLLQTKLQNKSSLNQLGGGKGYKPPKPQNHNFNDDDKEAYNDTCLICREELDTKEVMKLDCGHIFHSECILIMPDEFSQFCLACHNNIPYKDSYILKDNVWLLSDGPSWDEILTKTWLLLRSRITPFININNYVNVANRVFNLHNLYVILRKMHKWSYTNLMQIWKLFLASYEGRDIDYNALMNMLGNISNKPLNIPPEFPRDWWEYWNLTFILMTPNRGEQSRDMLLFAFEYNFLNDMNQMKMISNKDCFIEFIRAYIIYMLAPTFVTERLFYDLTNLRMIEECSIILSDGKNLNEVSDDWVYLSLYAANHNIFANIALLIFIRDKTLTQLKLIEPLDFILRRNKFKDFPPVERRIDIDIDPSFPDMIANE